MTRKETGIIMDILAAAYPRPYADLDDVTLRNMINLWTEMFRDDPVELVAAAVKAFIDADEKGFLPAIGAVKAKMRLLLSKDEMTEAEAWNLVAKAIKNSTYDSKAEFEKLPQTIKRIVGSPNMLREWAAMGAEVTQSVVASNFQRSYRAIVAREKELAKLPNDVRAMVEKIRGQDLAGQISGGDRESRKHLSDKKLLGDGGSPTQRSREEVLAFLEREPVLQSTGSEYVARSETATSRSTEEVIAFLKSGRPLSGEKHGN